MSSTVHTFEVHGISIKHWDPEAHRILWNTFVRVGLYSFACLGRGHLEVELERSNRGANVEGGGVRINGEGICGVSSPTYKCDIYIYILDILGL